MILERGRENSCNPVEPLPVLTCNLPLQIFFDKTSRAHALLPVTMITRAGMLI